MKIYSEWPKGRGYILRVSQELYQGHLRIDCRVWYHTRPGDGDTLRPTPKGLNIGMRDIPPLLAALQQAAADGLEAGHLKAEAFTRAGLSVPDTEQREVA